MTEPVWERLRAPDRRRLRVGPVRRDRVERLRIVDGDLPDFGGATVFDVWRDQGRVVVRAARIAGHDVEPIELAARSLEIDESDGRLEALLGSDDPVAAKGELERQACACRGIGTDAAYRAIAAGWATADAVKRATRIGFGSCQGRRCIPWLAERLELAIGDPRARITPRPPIVPVPVSVLAAFAETDG